MSVEAEITAMTFGPYAVGHVDGRTVMVPNAAPGDRIEVELVSERRDYSIGRIVRLISPGEDRRTAPCPFLPRCGGCDWQQLRHDAQARLKGRIVASELNRAFALTLDADSLVMPSAKEFGYRSRIRLRVGRDGALGFTELASNRLVEIDSCMVADPAIRIPVALARALGRDLEEIEVVASGDRNVLIADLRRVVSPKHLELARKLLESDRTIAGIVLRAGGRRESLSDVHIEIEVEPGLVLRADADVFSQVNHAQNRKLVELVMSLAEPGASSNVLDLFCGAGNLSLPAARRGARVTGVDSDAGAVAAAQRNAERLGLADRTQFVAMKAEQLARFLERAGYRPDTVILDPPRTGAAALMAPIAKLRAARVLYVSCDVATLVRDLRALTAACYRVARVRAFDFFPNTHHVEIVAEAVLT